MAEGALDPRHPGPLLGDGPHLVQVTREGDGREGVEAGDGLDEAQERRDGPHAGHDLGGPDQADPLDEHPPDHVGGVGAQDELAQDLRARGPAQGGDADQGEGGVHQHVPPGHAPGEARGQAEAHQRAHEDHGRHVRVDGQADPHPHQGQDAEDGRGARRGPAGRRHHDAGGPAQADGRGGEKGKQMSHRPFPSFRRGRCTAAGPRRTPKGLTAPSESAVRTPPR